MHVSHRSAPDVHNLNSYSTDVGETPSRPKFRHDHVVPNHERAALKRDRDDLESLGALWDAVLGAHQAVCRIPAPRHPERRWDVRDLLDALSNALTDIAAESDRIRNSPVVLEA